MEANKLSYSELVAKAALVQQQVDKLTELFGAENVSEGTRKELESLNAQIEKRASEQKSEAVMAVLNKYTAKIHEALAAQGIEIEAGGKLVLGFELRKDAEGNVTLGVASKVSKATTGVRTGVTRSSGLVIATLNDGTTQEFKSFRECVQTLSPKNFREAENARKGVERAIKAGDFKSYEFIETVKETKVDAEQYAAPVVDADTSDVPPTQG